MLRGVLPSILVYPTQSTARIRYPISQRKITILTKIDHQYCLE